MNISVLGCRFGRCIIYQRYLVATVCAMCFINLYAMRFAFPRVVPYLQRNTHNKTTNKTEPTCEKREYEISKETVFEMTRLGWTSNETHYMEISFYFLYILSHLPSGMLSDLYGPKHVLSFGMVTSCLLTLATPTAIHKCPWWVMVIMRIFLGLSQGVSMTAVFLLMANWTPTRQTSALTALAYSGTSIAHVMFDGSLFFFERTIRNWESLFYFWSGVSIVWFILYIFLIYSSPSTHPFVSKEEKDLMIADLGSVYPKSIPWKEILTDNSVWALFSGQVGHNWILFILASYLPTYFKDVLGYNVTSNLLMQSLPYGSMWLMVICSGFLGDYLINRDFVSVMYLRIIYTGIGNIFPSIFILAATYIGCRKMVLILVFMIAMICKGTVIAGLKANILDVTRHYVGTIFAIQNGLGAVTGLMIPITIKLMCPSGTKEEWKKAFWLSFAICIFSTTLYVIWTRSDRAAWDNIDKSET